MAGLAMAIQATQAALLMDIRREIVCLDTKGPGTVSLDRVWCPVFPVIVVLVLAVIIIAYVVTVMAAQALAVGWFGEAVILRAVFLQWEMAGGTTRSVACCIVGVTLGINVATQAAAPEHIVG